MHRYIIKPQCRLLGSIYLLLRVAPTEPSRFLESIAWATCPSGCRYAVAEAAFAQNRLYANGYSNRFWVINHKISRLRMVGWTTRTQTMQSDFRFLQFTEITMILCVKDMNRYWACHRCMQPILIILNFLCRKPRLIPCTTLFPPLQSLSAVDLLSACNLVNYFGKCGKVTKRMIVLFCCLWLPVICAQTLTVMRVYLLLGMKIWKTLTFTQFCSRRGQPRSAFRHFLPINTSTAHPHPHPQVSLYGLGNIRDERLNRMFSAKKIKFLRPKESQQERAVWPRILA